MSTGPDLTKAISVASLLKVDADRQALMLRLEQEARPKWEAFAARFVGGDLFKAQKQAWAQWLYSTPEDVASDKATMLEVWSAAYQAGATEPGDTGALYRAIDLFYKHRCDDVYFEHYKRRSKLKESPMAKQDESRTWWNYENNKQGWEWYS